MRLDDRQPSADSLETAVERIVGRFEDAWEQGIRPRPEDYLPHELPLRKLVLRELVGVDLERRLARGEAATVAEYLRRFPELDESPSVVMELIAAETELGDKTGGGETPRGLALQPGDTTLPPLADDSPRPMPTGAHEFPSIPGFRILREIGRGGMAVVYEARQLGLDRPVAIKLVDSARVHGAELSARLRREAQAVARLQHPHIVQVFDVGTHDGRPFLVLEYAGGGNLQERLSSQALAPREAAVLVADLASAVEQVHRLRLVHRDLKPANVLLAADGIAKVADFGLARIADDDAGLTRSGEIVGTPCYMAPEQALGDSRNVGPAADIYALGAILYTSLTGRPPFQAASTHETLEQVRHTPPGSLRRLVASIPRDLETICLKCLEKEPPRRYASAQLLADDLQRFLNGRPILARPVGSLGRLTRWARRSPVIAGLAAATVVLLMAVAVISALAAIKLNTSRREAVSLANVAQEGADRLAIHAYATLCQRALASLAGGAEPPARLLLNVPQNGLPQAFTDRFEWRFVANRFQRLPRRPLVLPPKVNLVRFLPGERRFVAADQLGTMHFVDGGTGEVVRRLKAHDACFNEIAFSADGQWACTANCDKTARIWRLPNWEPVGPSLKHSYKVGACAFSPDGRWLATATDDESPQEWKKHPSEISLWGWDEDKWTLAHTLQGEPAGILRLFFRDEGRQLIGVNAAHGVERFDLTSEPPARLPTLVLGRTNPAAHHVHRAALSPSGRWLAEPALAAVGIDLWDLEMSEWRSISCSGIDTPYALRFLDEDRLLFSAAGVGRLGIWNVKYNCLEADLGRTPLALDVDVSFDGSLFATGGEGGLIYCDTLAPAAPPAVQTILVPGLVDQHHQVSPDLKQLWGAEMRRKGHPVTRFSLPSGEPLPPLPDATYCNAGIEFAPDGRFVLYGSLDREGRTASTLLDLTHGSSRIVRTFQLTGRILCCLSADSRRIAIMDGPLVRTFDTPTGASVAEYAAPAGSRAFGGYDLAYLPDGQSLVFSDATSCRRLDLKSGRVSEFGSACVGFQVVSKLNQVLKLGDLGLCDAADGRLLVTYDGVTERVHEGDVSPDGQTVALVHGPHQLGLWDAQTGLFLGWLVDDQSVTWANCRFSPNGDQLAAWGFRPGHKQCLVMFFRAAAAGAKSTTVSP